MDFDLGSIARHWFEHFLAAIALALIVYGWLLASAGRRVK